MTMGDVLGEAWSLYTRFIARFVLIALIVFAVVNGIYALVVLAFDGDSDGTAFLLAILGAVASFVGTFWLQGALVHAVEDARDGTLDSSTGETFRKATPALLSLIGAGILAGIGIAIGFVLLIVPGLLLLTIWAVIAPVIVLEGRSALESFGRSRELVRGHGWTVFAIVVVTGLATAIASGLVRAVFSFLPRWLEFFVGGTIAQAVTAPLMAIALTVLYFRLRDAQGGATPAVTPESP